MTAQENAPKIRAALPALLEKLSMRQASDGINLPPMEVHTTGRLTAEIKRVLQNLLETDTFSVKVTGESADPRGSYESPVLEFGPPNLRTLNLEPKLVAFNLRQKIKVEYTVNRADEDSVISEVLELNVLDLAPEALKAGVIFGKDDDGTGPVLDLTTDTEDRTVRIENWPLIAVGQWCWIVAKGVTADDPNYEETLFKGKVDQDWITLGYKEVSVLFSELKLLANESALTLEYMVAFDQADDKGGANPSEVRSYIVKNVVAVKPAITKLTDPDGNPVADNGETTATTLKLEGTAGVGVDVEIFVGGVRKDAVKAEGGTWRYELTGLSVDTHVIKVVASGLDSNTWTVTVTLPVVTPVITKVTDSSDVEIPDGQSTLDTTLKLTGTAGAGEQVGIYVNGTLMESFTAEGGKWTYTLTKLVPETCKLQAGGLGSAVWTVTVRGDIEPEISSVIDGVGRQLSSGGGTRSGTVTLKGKATRKHKVEIIDFSTKLAVVDAGDNGTWERTLQVQAKRYDIVIKDADSGARSKIFTFTVDAI